MCSTEYQAPLIGTEKMTNILSNEDLYFFRIFNLKTFLND